MKPEIEEAAKIMESKKGIPVGDYKRLKEVFSDRGYWNQESYTMEELKVWIRFSGFYVQFNLWSEEFSVEDDSRILTRHTDLKTALEEGLKEWKNGATSYSSISY